MVKTLVGYKVSPPTLMESPLGFTGEEFFSFFIIKTTDVLFMTVVMYSCALNC